MEEKNSLKVFNNPEFGKVRTFIEPDGTILYSASDIASALGYERPNNAVTAHCPHALKRCIGVVTGVKSDGSEATQQVEMNFIPEGDVYRLIVSSKLPSAERFERWLFDEVVPTIRKHGAYMTPETLEKTLTNPDFIIRLATELKQEQERRQALEAQHQIDQPKAFFADAVRTSETCINIGDLAKLIDQNGVPMGRTRLFKWLRSNGWLMKSGNEINSPTQKGREYGFFKIKENTIVKPSGEVLTTKTTRVTGKGQIYFINLFCNPLEKEQIRAAE